MLSTFTGTGHIKPDRSDEDGQAWTRGGTGAMILETYDHLTGLTAAS